jgi:hypothetical protein
MESKSNNWISTGKASFLTSEYTQYSAFSACSTSFFFVSKNVPLYLNITPRYEYVSTLCYVTFFLVNHKCAFTIFLKGTEIDIILVFHYKDRFLKL